mmetsp:Transcript_45224/g.137117  ORF Transcript_45224/g.137117 Transcript_45224/m.137117 type:complete len:215 (-) Transcript_45224:196-840(-)
MDLHASKVEVLPHVRGPIARGPDAVRRSDQVNPRRGCEACEGPLLRQRQSLQVVHHQTQGPQRLLSGAPCHPNGCGNRLHGTRLAHPHAKPLGQLAEAIPKRKARIESADTHDRGAPREQRLVGERLQEQPFRSHALHQHRKALLQEPEPRLVVDRVCGSDGDRRFPHWCPDRCGKRAARGWALEVILPEVGRELVQRREFVIVRGAAAHAGDR